MNNLNSVLIEGTINGKPEIKTKDGIMTCVFYAASNRIGNRFEKETSFFKVETTGKLAEIMMAKGHDGRGIRIVGRLKQNWWKDDDKELQSEIVIIPEHVEFTPEFKNKGVKNDNNP